MASGVQFIKNLFDGNEKICGKKLKGDVSFEWLMIDSSYMKAHQHAAGARGGNQVISKTKGGSIRKCT